MISDKESNKLASRFLFSSFAFFSIILAYFSYVKFEAWPQVTDLYSYHLPVYLLYDHPHLFRYLISYPGLWMEEFYGSSFFSIYVSFFMILSVFVLSKIMKGIDLFIVVISCIIMIFIHAFMNGRGVISWCGWLVAIYFVIKSDRAGISYFDTLVICFSLLASSVSTGTFAVTFATLAFYALKSIFMLKNLKSIIVFLPNIYIFWNYFILSFDKNIEYYTVGRSNTLINMLEHGLGGLISSSPMFIAMSVILGILSFFIVDAMRRRLSTTEISILMFPLIGGLFGYTVLTLAIPSVLVVFARRLTLASPARLRSSYSSFGAAGIARVPN